MRRAVAGQSDVAHYLLEAGAVCNEYTFDGDRCHYAALTSTIRFGHSPQQWGLGQMRPAGVTLEGLPSAYRLIIAHDASYLVAAAISWGISAPIGTTCTRPH